MQQGMTAESAAPYLVDQAATQPQQRPRHPACPRLLHIGPTTFRVTCCLWTEPQQHTSRALLHIGHLALCSHWQQPGGPCINLLASTNLHQPTCINQHASTTLIGPSVLPGITTFAGVQQGDRDSRGRSSSASKWFSRGPPWGSSRRQRKMAS